MCRLKTNGNLELFLRTVENPFILPGIHGAIIVGFAIVFGAFLASTHPRCGEDETTSTGPTWTCACEGVEASTVTCNQASALTKMFRINHTGQPIWFHHQDERERIGREGERMLGEGQAGRGGAGRREVSSVCGRRPHAKLNLRTERIVLRWPLQ